MDEAQPQTAANDMQALLQQIDVLGRENALLRMKSTMPQTERLLQDVVSAELRDLITTSLGRLSTEAPAAGPDTSAWAALEEICKKNVNLETALREIEENVVAPLRSEKDALETRCSDLMSENASLAEVGSTQNETLKQRLDDALALEKQLQQEISLLRHQSVQTVNFVKDTFERLQRDMDVNSNERTHHDKTKDLVATMQLRFRESQEAHRLALEKCMHNSRAEIECEKEATGQLRIAFEEMKRESMQHVTRLAALDDEVHTLRHTLSEREREDKSFDLPAFQELKRRRLEVENISSSCIRSELIHFWFDGHERIEALESEIGHLQQVKQELRLSRHEVHDLKKTRGECVESITALTKEVEQLREEAVRLRSLNIGLHAENSTLVQELGRLLVTDMSTAEVSATAAALRRSARAAAEANAHAVVDPVATEAALRKAQEMRHEMNQLTQRKDELLQLIKMRESRLAALEHTAAIIHDSPAVAPPGAIELAPQLPDCDRISLQDEAVALRQEVLRLIDEKVSFVKNTLAQLTNMEEVVNTARVERSRFELQAQQNLELSRSTMAIANVAVQAVSEQLTVIESHHNALTRIQLQVESLRASLQSSSPNGPTIGDVEPLLRKLSEHLTLIGETINIESRRHSVQETKFIQALVEDLKVKEAAVEVSRKAFEAEIVAVDRSLIQRISNVRNEWDSKIKKDFENATSERIRAEKRLLSDAEINSTVTKLTSGVQCSLHANEVQPASSPNDASAAIASVVTSLIHEEEKVVE